MSNPSAHAKGSWSAILREQDIPFSHYQGHQYRTRSRSQAADISFTALHNNYGAIASTARCRHYN